MSSARLDLVSLSVEILRCIVADDRATISRLLDARLAEEWMRGRGDLARMWIDRIGAEPDHAPWLARAVVLRDPSRVVVGDAGFHMKPDARGFVEVGYTVEPAFRRLGYAEEAVRALADGAARAGAVGLRASVSPSNGASLALVKKLGLVAVGRHVDEEDGEETVFEGPLPLR